jgi:NADPH:quinone reductase-like Zn-dependent oxidoreductase
VQISKARGAYVTGTARSAKHPFLTELGADETIDYTTEAVEERVRDVDVVLDLVGGESSHGALRTLRDGGIFIAVPSSSGIESLRELAGGRVRITGILVEPDRVGMEALAELAGTGALRAHVSGTFPLEQAARAHELGETGRTQGKLVLTVD